MKDMEVLRKIYKYNATIYQNMILAINIQHLPLLRSFIIKFAIPLPFQFQLCQSKAANKRQPGIGLPIAEKAINLHFYKDGSHTYKFNLLLRLFLDLLLHQIII